MTTGYTHILLVYIAECVLGLSTAKANNSSTFPKVWHEFHQCRQSRYIWFSFLPSPPQDYKEVTLFPELLIFSKSWFKTILVEREPQNALALELLKEERWLTKKFRCSLKFCSEVNWIGELKTISILISTGQHGLVLLCHTVFAPQHPQSSSSTQPLRSGLHPPCADNIFYNWRFLEVVKLGQRTPSTAMAKENTHNLFFIPWVTIFYGFLVVGVTVKFSYYTLSTPRLCLYSSRILKRWHCDTSGVRAPGLWGRISCVLPELKHFLLTAFPECPFQPLIFEEDSYAKDWVAPTASGTTLHLLEHNELQYLQGLLTVHVNIGLFFPFI